MTFNFAPLLIGSLATLLQCGSGSCDIEEQQHPVLEARVKQEIPEPSVAKIISEPLSGPLFQVQSEQIKKTTKLNVPFTSQAPSGNWGAPFNEACEEASLIMLQYYWNNKDLSPETAKNEIEKIVEWETDRDYIIDIGADEAAAVAEAYFSRTSYVYKGENVTVDNIKKLLSAGYPVIIPVAGRDLKNPHFVGAGPPYHMLVLIGYDENNFITHEPGNSQGANYPYSQDIIMNAIHDWTGSKSSVHDGQKAMIIVTNEVAQRF